MLPVLSCTVFTVDVHLILNGLCQPFAYECVKIYFEPNDFIEQVKVS